MKKKLVDLIYLDEKQMESDLKDNHRSMINGWLEWIDKKFKNVSMEGLLIDEQSEYLVLSNFLRNFLNARFEWICDSVPDADLRNKYLLVLQPFHQKWAINSFVQHFFQFKDDKNPISLKFNFLNHSEREIRILWDIYKLTKTKESIDILLRSASGDNPFPSIFPSEYIINMLAELSKALLLLVQIIIKPEYQDQIFIDFPMDCLEPDSILQRKTSNSYIVNDIVLEKFDYRNYFFHIFFRSGMKAMYKGKKLVFKYNYLDFEIIKQEFLTQWLTQRLATNSKKKEVFDRYEIGNQTLSEIIAKDPAAELTLLKQLPKEVFDDLIADVNEVVDDEDKTPINPMSEKIGEFAEKLKQFKKANEWAKQSIQAIRSYLSKLGKTYQNKIDKRKFDQKKSDKVEEEAKSEFQIEVLSETDIDYPYFCLDDTNCERQLSIFKNQINQTGFSKIDQKVQDHLSSLEESKLIKRRVPIQEWAIPYRIKEITADKTIQHLLILGAEVKTKPLGMGYGIGVKNQVQLNVYFVYGSDKLLLQMGAHREHRIMDGRKLYIYDYYNPLVVEKALKLINIVLDNQSKGSK